MGKFKVRLSFKEFNLELEGSRDEIPQLGHNLSRQIAGMIAGSTANIAPGPIPLVAVNDQPNRSVAETPKKKKTGKSGYKSEVKAVNWHYDGQLYGLPRQSWSTTEKAVWLLYVGDKTTGIKELRTGQINNVFNEHYRDAKSILQPNISRDLNKLKNEKDSPVGKNKNGWFLTQEGQKMAEKLIAALAN